MKSFLLESLIEHVFQHQVERGVVNKNLELFIFVDDAQRLVNSNGTSTMSGLDEKVGKLAEAGLASLFFSRPCTEHLCTRCRI